VGARSGPAPIDAPLPRRAEEPSALPDRTGWRGGARQPRSRRLHGNRRHADPRVGPRHSPALPGRRPLKAMARQCRSRRPSAEHGPPRRSRRPGVDGRHLDGCQPAAQSARPPAPAPPRRPPRPDQPPGDHSSHRLVPSGHAASASAFATGVATAWPEAGLPLSAAAALVGYPGVHTGVHYPVDVIAGSLTGTTLAQLTAAALGRRRGRRASGLNATCHDDPPPEQGGQVTAPPAQACPPGHVCAHRSRRVGSPPPSNRRPRTRWARFGRPSLEPAVQRLSSPRRRRTASSSHDH